MLREIETFLTAVRYGTFTEAGQKQGLTQSAVSEQIRRFEDYVGRRLFFRTGRSATLNAAGHDIIPIAEQIVALVAEMRGRGPFSAMHATLRVGTIASLHNGLLARAMLDFHLKFPGVTLRSTRGEDDLLGQVEREELDLAVVIRPLGELPRNVLWHPLLSKRFVLIVPAGTVAEGWREAILCHPLLRYDHSTVSGRQIDAFLEHTGVTIEHSVWMNFLDTMIALVGQGMGVALVPFSDFGGSSGRIRVFELGEAVFHRRIGVLTRRNGVSGETAAFLALLQQEAYHEEGATVATAPFVAPERSMNSRGER